MFTSRRPARSAHKFGPRHVHGAVDGPRLRPRIVLEDFDHQRGVVGQDHAGLQHAQKPDLSFGLAESTGGIDCHIGVEALANSGDPPRFRGTCGLHLLLLCCPETKLPEQSVPMN